jgi:hypothetical protein
VDEALDLVIPPELEAGVYADWFFPWFTPHHLVLDLAAPLAGEGLMLTSRVRIPATAVFQLLAALNQAIQAYELQFGEIRRPRERSEE